MRILSISMVAMCFCCCAPDKGPEDHDTERVVRGLAAACDEPEIFEPGNVSLSATEEYRIAFTPNGSAAYFGRSEQFFPISRQSTIYVTRFADGVWSSPEVAPFSGVYSDIDPFVSLDGRRIYFSSIRPVDGVERADADVWVVERGPGGAWGEPQNLGPAVNSPNDELYPSVTVSGDLYVASDRPGGFGGWDIYRSEYSAGTYRPAENLGPAINTNLWEYNPWISAHGHVLVFASLGRPEGFGSGDLYASIRVGSEWRGARNLGSCVNTADDEYHPTVVPSRGSIFFVRHRYQPWVPGDLYHLGPIH